MPVTQYVVIQVRGANEEAVEGPEEEVPGNKDPAAAKTPTVKENNAEVCPYVSFLLNRRIHKACPSILLFG